MPKFDFESNAPLFLLTTSPEFRTIIAQAVKEGIETFAAEEQAKKRLTTKEAAKFLGCSTYYMQELHKQGLAYEKGHPNFYRLGDLEALQKSRRLNLND